MLTLSKPMSSSSIVNYHTFEENYYSKEGDSGFWYGKGAKELGLKGSIDPKDLEKISLGKNIKNEPLLKLKKSDFNENGDRKRAGQDLTFSAPKSVSIIYELSKANKDNGLANKILKAHQEAVKKSLDFVEKEYIQTREQKNGQRIKINTKNMIAAVYTHDTSRSVDGRIDPSLHCHAVVMNMTQKNDGTWKSLETKKIFENQLAIGLYYRGELAKNLKQLGFEIKITDPKQGFWEIKGVDEKLIEHFSSRREQILDEVERLKKEFPNAKDAELKQIANLNTRKWKGEIDREKVREENKLRAEALGYGKEWLEKIRETQKEISNTNITPKDIIKEAIASITENNSIFSMGDVMSAAVKMALKFKIGSEELYKTFNASFLETFKEHQTIKISEDIYTTKQMVDFEKDIVSNMKSNQNSLKIFIPKDEAQKRVQEYSKQLTEKGKFPLTKGQARAANFILSSKDSIIGIQGYAGTGKTTMLKAVNSLKDKNVYMHGLAFTGKAVKEIEKEGLKAETLAKFINRENSEKDTLLGKRVVSKEEHEEIAKNNQKILDQFKEAGIDIEKLKQTDTKSNAKELEKYIQDIKKQRIGSFIVKALKNSIKSIEDFNQANRELAKKLGFDNKFNSQIDYDKLVMEQLDETVNSMLGIKKDNFNPDKILNEAIDKADQKLKKLVKDALNKPKHKISIKEGDRYQTFKFFHKSIGNDRIYVNFKVDKKTGEIYKGITISKYDKSLLKGEKQYTNYTIFKEDKGIGVYESKVKINAAGLEESFSKSDYTLENYIKKDSQILLTVDEASTVGTKDAFNIVKFQEKAKALGVETKVVYLGDSGQQKAISAGDPFYLLKSNGMRVEQMDEVVRAKTDFLKDINKDFHNKNYTEAFEKLDRAGKIIEINDKARAIDAIADRYIKQLENNEDTLIVTGLNADKRLINETIKEKLQNKGYVSKDGVVLNIKENSSLIGIQKRQSENYKNGQTLYINENIGDIKKGREGFIKDVDNKNNNILISINGKDYKINILKDGDKLQVYNDAQKKFSKNEKIVFGKNDNKLKVKNGQIGTIKSIDKNGNLIVKTDNKEVKFNISEYPYIDSGYAVTEYKSQGMTKDNTIAYMPSNSPASANSFYVAVTRAKKDITIYTDLKEDPSLKDENLQSKNGLKEKIEKELQKFNATTFKEQMKDSFKTQNKNVKNHTLKSQENNKITNSKKERDDKKLNNKQTKKSKELKKDIKANQKSKVAKREDKIKHKKQQNKNPKTLSKKKFPSKLSRLLNKIESLENKLIESLKNSIKRFNNIAKDLEKNKTQKEEMRKESAIQEKVSFSLEK